MRNRRNYVLSMVMVAVLLVPGMLLVAPTGRAETTASWTFAIYVAGDNSLENYWDSTTLPFLKAVPPSDQVNLVAFVDLKTTSTTEVVKVSGTTVTTVETYGEMDTGNPATLTWSIDRATTLWPSTYFALMLWDHGFGWHYICSDDTSGSSIDMPELQSGIANAGNMINVLELDACNMAMVEVAYQVSLTNLVQYMVASEEYMAGDGLPLTTVLTPLVNNPSMLPRDLSIVMVDAYGAAYTNTNGGKMAIASIDLPQLKAINRHVHDLVGEDVVPAADIQDLLRCCGQGDALHDRVSQFPRPLRSGIPSAGCQGSDGHAAQNSDGEHAVGTAVVHRQVLGRTEDVGLQRDLVLLGDLQRLVLRRGRLQADGILSRYRLGDIPRCVQRVEKIL